MQDAGLLRPLGKKEVDSVRLAEHRAVNPGRYHRGRHLLVILVGLHLLGARLRSLASALSYWIEFVSWVIRQSLNKWWMCSFALFAVGDTRGKPNVASI